MIGQIGEAKINEVRERSDIIELISQYVTLKRAGANHMGLCPFHSEKSPSFSVHAGRQFFHCFGCGVGGDVFSFLMKIEGLAFPDALKRLAGRAGIELEERQLSPEEEQRQQQRERFYRVNELAADYFHQLLMEQPSGEPGRQYLKQRGYGRKAAGEYQIGYALDAWEGLAKHLKQQGVRAEDARELGLIRPGKEGRGDYDLFRGRLMFPIYDLAGQVVAFGGRVLDDSKPKYINSPESPIYHKGRVLYGLYQARQAMRQSGEVILVEGYFDQLALYRAGFPQVVATCGTAMTVDHARLLKRYVQRVLLLFDQDPAGKQATFKAMAALQEEGIPALVIELPSGDDPDSFVQQQGAEAFRQRLEKARPAMDLFMEDALAQAAAGIEGKVRAAETIVERIAGLTSAMQQDLYLKDLSGRSGIDLQLLKQKLAGIERKASSAQSSQRSEPSRPEYSGPPPVDDAYARLAQPVVVPKAPPKAVWSKAEGMLLCLLIHNSEARQKIAVSGVSDYFHSAQALQIAEQLLAEPEAETATELAVRLAPDMLSLLQPLLAADPAQFSDGIDEMLSDCRAALAREQKKRRREELLGQIRQSEQAGGAEIDEELLNEFKKLK
ncbi:MAG TPA: DNA primase [Malonomonas sp.]